MTMAMLRSFQGGDLCCIALFQNALCQSFNITLLAKIQEKAQGLKTIKESLTFQVFLYKHKDSSFLFSFGL